MNDQFGFFSHFNKTKTNKPPTSRIPRVPIIRKPNPVLMTDDEDSDENIIPESGNLKNNIFNTTSTDNTYCSEIENKDMEVSKQTSKAIFDTDELIEGVKKKSSSVSRHTQADTVVGSFSSDEERLSTQISGLQLKSAKKQSKSSQRSDLKDTIYDPFDSDESYDDPKPTQKKLNKTSCPPDNSSFMRETIVGSFNSDEDNEEEEENKDNFVKPTNLPKYIPPTIPKNLRETIDNPFEYSESVVNSTKKSIHEVLNEIDSTTDKFSGIELNENEGDNEESDDSDIECITVLDSDEEAEGSLLNDNDEPPRYGPKDSFINCSSVAVSEPTNSRETDNTLNRFFNNPPSLDSNEVVTHAIIHKHFKKPEPEEKITTIPETTVDRFQTKEDEIEINDSFELEATIRSEDEIVDATIMTDENDGQDILGSELSYKSSSSEKETQETEKSLARTTSHVTQDPESQGDNFEIGNFHLKINLNVEFTVEDATDSSSDEEVVKSPVKKPSTPLINFKVNSAKNSPRTPANTPVSKPTQKTSNQKSSANKNILNHSVLRGEVPAINRASTTIQTSKAADNFLTPTRTNQEPSVIDDDLQKILNDLYGESWKTPQLLKSCQKTKNVESLRKSIAANNFENFVKNLPSNLDSTRVSRSDSSESLNTLDKNYEKERKLENPFVTPKNLPKARTIKTSSVKKTPQTCKTPASSLKSTPKYLEICDPDTPSEGSEDESFSESSESSDEDFRPEESWNASSSDEAHDGEVDDVVEVKEVPKKNKKSIRNRTHGGKDEDDFIFEPASEKKQPIDTNKAYEDLLDQFEFKKPVSMVGIDTPTKAPKPKRKLFTHSHYEDDVEPVTVNKPTITNRDDDKENEKVTIVFPLPIAAPRTISTITTKKTPANKEAVKKVEKTPVITPTSSTISMKFQKYSFLKSLDVESNIKAFCDPEALVFKENYKSKKGDLAQRLLKIYNENIFENKLQDVEIKWNKKLLNTAGRCNNSKKNGERKCHVELSDKVLTSADRLRCTLIHELCHAATWLFHGENGHGSTWKRWAAKANRIFPELPKINVCHDYIIEYRYTYQCVSCKAKYQTHSKSKKVENIRCSICKSAIELFLNKKSKTGEIVMTPVSKDVKGFPKFVKEKYKEVKKPNMAHKDVMQALSQQFAALSADEKSKLYA